MTRSRRGPTSGRVPRGARLRSGAVVWSLGALAPGAHVTVHLRVRTSTAPLGDLRNIAAASAANAATVRARATTHLIAPPRVAPARGAGDRPTRGARAVRPCDAGGGPDAATGGRRAGPKATHGMAMMSSDRLPHRLRDRRGRGPGDRTALGLGTGATIAWPSCSPSCSATAYDGPAAPRGMGLGAAVGVALAARHVLDRGDGDRRQRREARVRRDGRRPRTTACSGAAGARAGGGLRGHRAGQPPADRPGEGSRGGALAPRPTGP